MRTSIRTSILRVLSAAALAVAGRRRGLVPPPRCARAAAVFTAAGGFRGGDFHGGGHGGGFHGGGFHAGGFADHGFGRSRLPSRSGLCIRGILPGWGGYWQSVLVGSESGGWGSTGADRILSAELRCARRTERIAKISGRGEEGGPVPSAVHALSLGFSPAPQHSNSGSACAWGELAADQRRRCRARRKRASRTWPVE